jgi:hypothetical protein
MVLVAVQAEPNTLKTPRPNGHEADQSSRTSTGRMSVDRGGADSKCCGAVMPGNDRADIEWVEIPQRSRLLGHPSCAILFMGSAGGADSGPGLIQVWPKGLLGCGEIIE